jgi:hypothetical protein
MKLVGEIDKDYLKTDELGVESTVWSPCGAEGMLNINSAIQLSPLKSEEPALMTASNLKSAGLISMTNNYSLYTIGRVDGSQIQADLPPAVEEVQEVTKDLVTEKEEDEDG